MAPSPDPCRSGDTLRRVLPAALRQRLGAAYYTMHNTLALRCAPLPGERSEGVDLFGQLTEASGMGEVSRLLAGGLQAAAVPVSLHPLRSYSGVEVPVPTAEALFTPETPHGVNLFVGNADCSEYFLRQAGAGVLQGRYNIAHWSWELPVFPARWQRCFARYDEIWTLSQFCADAIGERSSVPVRVIPCGICPQPDLTLRRGDFGLPEHRLLFLSMFDVRSIQSRKNPLGALDAYCRAFPRDDGDTALVLKINGGGEGLALLRALSAERRDIYLLEGIYSNERTDALIALCDVFLSLHRAEGFGLSIAEAMALGKSVVVTGWSGNMDFTSPENACCVGCTLRAVGADAAPPYDAWQQWAEPKVDEAVDCLRSLGSDSELRRRLGEAGARTMAERYSPRRCGEVMAARLRELELL